MEMHYDGCHMTWQIMLSLQDKYEEGGETYIGTLRQTIKLNAGQAGIGPSRRSLP
jgi:hypothetical protein